VLAGVHPDGAGAREHAHSNGNGNGRGRDRRPAGEDPEIASLRAQLKAHPCHGCPKRDDHARWAERYAKLDRDAAGLRRRIEQRTNTIARHFDRVCEVLEVLGYLEGDIVTPAGERLGRLYAELDLLAAECLRADTWAGLDPAELAAALSGLTFEARNSDDAGPPRLPRGAIRSATSAMVSAWAELDRLERDHRLDGPRRPDFGFSWAAWRWASGAALDDVLEESEMAAGDFVRNVKQLVDLTDQVADAAGPGPLRDAARLALGSLRRGVVAYSSVSA
jgi:ATP-dependent RNA helicase HelY